MALAGEALAAAGAGVRHLARVGPSVQQQLPGGQKGLPACGAQVILLPFVHLHVSCNACFAEAFPADRTQVGGAFMQAFMLLERIVAEESLVALAADEYPSSLVESLVLIITRRAGEPLLTLAAVIREVVELHVSLQLIWMFKDLFTLRAFGFFLCEVLVHSSRTQKPFVFHRGLFPSTSFLVFQVVLLLLPFALLFNTVFLFAFPLFLRVASYFLFFSVQVFSFLLSLCSGFFNRQSYLNGSCYVVLTLDVLLDLLLYAVSKGTLRTDE